MKQIVILDFSTAIVYIREVPEVLEDSQAEDVIEYFESVLKIRANDCQYMMGELSFDGDGDLNGYA